MATVPVLNQQGEKTGVIELSDEIFAAEVKEHLFYDVVRAQLAAKRNANPATRSRARVSGGGKKPYRQKGTGRARQGSSRSPHFRGGGVVFGPNGRKYTIQLNKKVRRAALRSALSLRLAQSELVVVDQIEFAAPRTREFVQVAGNLSADKALYVTGATNENLYLSSRNVQSVKVLTTAGLNVYDILRYPRLVLTASAVQSIQERLKA
jgi:large subunit ribosomal protein L4